MRISRIAATTYGIVSVGLAAFQIALAAGAPWGAYAMGGAFPGQFPPLLRITALVQSFFILAMAAVVLSRAGLVFAAWSRAACRLVWLVVGVAASASVLNLITPSSRERAIWAPVALLLLMSSLAVACSERADKQGRQRGHLDIGQN